MNVLSVAMLMNLLKEIASMKYSRNTFAELPPSWRCPVCGAKASQFQNIGPVGMASGFQENLSYGLGVNQLTPTQKNLLIFWGLALPFVIYKSYGLQ